MVRSLLPRVPSGRARARWVITAVLMVVVSLVPANWVWAYLVASFFLDGAYSGAHKRAAARTLLEVPAAEGVLRVLLWTARVQWNDLHASFLRSEPHF